MADLAAFVIDGGTGNGEETAFGFTRFLLRDGLWKK